MKFLKYIYENSTIIVCVAYLWILPICGWNGSIKIQPYHIGFAILAAVIYISDKIEKELEKIRIEIATRIEDTEKKVRNNLK